MPPDLFMGTFMIGIYTTRLPSLTRFPLCAQIYHHTVDRTERTLAAIGLVTAGYGGGKAAYASFQYLRAAKKRSS